MNFSIAYGVIILTMLSTVYSSADLQASNLGRDIRESGGDVQRSEDIFTEFQGICLKENDKLSANRLKTLTTHLIQNMEIYKDIIKMNKQLKKDIKWILQETKNEKEISNILHILRQEVKATCAINYKDCASLKAAGMTSGVYSIYPRVKSSSKIQVYCDMETDKGGWIVIQKRVDGSVNFRRKWDEYENGFGSKDGEYWLGNKWIHRLTKSDRYELRIDLVDTNGKQMYAKYKTFEVGSAADKYKLTVGGYSGNSGDDMQYHSGVVFSTYDRDSDTSSGNCAESMGAWWHKSCCHSSLNDKFKNKLYWKNASGGRVLRSEMKIRRY